MSLHVRQATYRRLYRTVKLQTCLQELQHRRINKRSFVVIRSDLLCLCRRATHFAARVA